jgi:archaellum biogenesis protein FlaJ (TadC family)
MTAHRLAMLLVILGGSIVVAGVALISIPLAIILAGVGLAAIGLLAIDVDRKVRP